MYIYIYIYMYVYIKIYECICGDAPRAVDARSRAPGWCTTLRSRSYGLKFSLSLSLSLSLSPALTCSLSLAVFPSNFLSPTMSLAHKHSFIYLSSSLQSGSPLPPLVVHLDER